MLSVIIPTLNESDYLQRTLGQLSGIEDLEIIVVDASSSDGTPEIAQQHGCRLLSADRGRAVQMNTGAAAASGSILLFLHADTQLPTRFDHLVRVTLNRPNVVAGAFQLRIDAPMWPLRLIETAVNIRSRWLGMPYGDQAIFTRADAFHSIGGFSDVPIMEDFELIRRLRRHGRIAIAPDFVVTSARRWQALGPWHTTWINQRIVIGYYLGISPERLARWYDNKQCKPNEEMTGP